MKNRMHACSSRASVLIERERGEGERERENLREFEMDRGRKLEGASVATYDPATSRNPAVKTTSAARRAARPTA